MKGGSDGLRTVAAATQGAAIVRVKVDVDVGAGRTDAGTPFHAARATAVVEIGRHRVTLNGGHAAAKSRAAAEAVALEFLLPRVATCLTF